MEEIKAGYENVRLQDGDGNKITSTGGALNISGSISFAEEAVVADGGALPAKVKVIAGYDGANVQVIKTDGNGVVEVGGEIVAPIYSIDNQLFTINNELQSLGLSLQSGNQKTQLVDSAGDVADVKSLSVNLVNSDKGLVTNTVIHGITTGGGGGYVDVKVNPSGALTVEADIASSVLPTGAATETTLQSINTHLFELDSAIVLDKATYTIGGARVVVGGYVFDDIADAPALSENTAAAARININRSQVGVIEDASTRGRYASVTASNALKVDGSAVTQPVSFASMPLPTGAATETTLSALNGKVTACNTGSVTIASSALPTGAATEITLSAFNTKMPSQGQALMAASVPVVIASNQTAIPVTGSFTAGKLSVVDLLDANILDTSSTNIPGSAGSPVQVVASLAATVKSLQLLDTTGAFVGVYVGGVGVEVLKLVMGPGSDQTIEHEIPSGSRVSLKRLDSTTAVSSGIVAINFLG